MHNLTRQFLTTTRLTKETAFNEMFHIHIMPPILMTIRVTMIRTVNAETISRPVTMKVTTKIANSDNPIDKEESSQIVKYCS